MTAVLSLARHTILDALREKAFMVVGLFALLLLGASRLLSPLALGEGRRVTLDLGLGGIAVLGLLLLILLGTRMVHREIDRKTILLLLSKPIRREEFILGKFLGLVGVLSISVAGMVLLLATILWASGHAVEPALAVAGYYAWLELVVLSAVAMLLTAFTSPVLSTLFLLGLYLAGHLAGSLLDLAAMLPAGGARQMFEAVFWVLPRLDLFSYTLEVVHGVPIDAGQVLGATLYAVVYSVGALALGALAFRSREFS